MERNKLQKIKKQKQMERSVFQCKQTIPILRMGFKSLKTCYEFQLEN